MRSIIIISVLALISLGAAAQEAIKPPVVNQVSVAQQIQELQSDLESLDIVAPLKLTPEQIQVILAEVQPAVDRIKELDTKREASLVELRDALIKAKNEALAGKQPSADVIKKLAAVQKAAGTERATAADEASAIIWQKLSTVLDENQKKTVYDSTRTALKNINTPNYMEIPQRQLGAYFTREVLMIPRQIGLMKEIIALQKTETTRKLNE